jgi:hypothetical protein
LSAFVLRYRNLLAVENAFKAASSIFHKTDAAIRGHIFCTFLAMVLRTELIQRFAKLRRTEPLEWQSIIDDLADLSEIEVEQDGPRANLRSIDPCRHVVPKINRFVSRICG